MRARTVGERRRACDVEDGQRLRRHGDLGAPGAGRSSQAPGGWQQSAASARGARVTAQTCGYPGIAVRHWSDAWGSGLRPRFWIVRTALRGREATAPPSGFSERLSAPACKVLVPRQVRGAPVALLSGAAGSARPPAPRRAVRRREQTRDVT